MKKDPVPEEPEDTRTTWDRFVENTRHVMGVPKEEIDKRDAAWRKKRG